MVAPASCRRARRRPSAQAPRRGGGGEGAGRGRGGGAHAPCGAGGQAGAGRLWRQRRAAVRAGPGGGAAAAAWPGSSPGSAGSALCSVRPLLGPARRAAGRSGTAEVGRVTLPAPLQPSAPQRRRRPAGALDSGRQEAGVELARRGGAARCSCRRAALPPAGRLCRCARAVPSSRRSAPPQLCGNSSPLPRAPLLLGLLTSVCNVFTFTDFLHVHWASTNYCCGLAWCTVCRLLKYADSQNVTTDSADGCPLAQYLILEREEPKESATVSQMTRAH